MGRPDGKIWRNDDVTSHATTPTKVLRECIIDACMLYPRNAPDVKGKSRLVNWYNCPIYIDDVSQNDAAPKVIYCEQEKNIRNLYSEHPAPCTIFRKHSQFPHHPGSLLMMFATRISWLKPKVTPKKYFFFPHLIEEFLKNMFILKDHITCCVPTLAAPRVAQVQKPIFDRETSETTAMARTQGVGKWHYRRVFERYVPWRV